MSEKQNDSAVSQPDTITRALYCFRVNVTDAFNEQIFQTEMQKWLKSLPDCNLRYKSTPGFDQKIDKKAYRIQAVHTDEIYGIRLAIPFEIQKEDKNIKASRLLSFIFNKPNMALTVEESIESDTDLDIRADVPLEKDGGLITLLMKDGYIKDDALPYSNTPISADDALALAKASKNLPSSPILYLSRIFGYMYAYNAAEIAARTAGAAHVLTEIDDKVHDAAFKKLFASYAPNKDLPQNGEGCVCFKSGQYIKLDPRENHNSSDAVKAALSALYSGSLADADPSVTWNRLTDLIEESHRKAEEEEEAKATNVYKNLVHEYQMLQDKTADMEKRCSDAESAAAELREANSKLKAENNGQQEKITFLNENCRKLTDENSRLAEKVKTLSGGEMEKMYEDEIHRLQTQLAEKTSELDKLNTDLYEASKQDEHSADTAAGTPLLVTGSETDMYPDEIKSIVLNALSASLRPDIGNGFRCRRNDIINDILAANEFDDANSKAKVDINRTIGAIHNADDFLRVSEPVFSKYNIMTRMDPSGNKRLIFFMDDKRYSVTMPVNEEDFSRLAAEICKMLF